MLSDDFEYTLEDFHASKCMEIINSADKKECFNYQTLLNNYLKENNKINDKYKLIIEFISNICFFMFKPYNSTSKLAC